MTLQDRIKTNEEEKKIATEASGLVVDGDTIMTIQEQLLFYHAGARNLKTSIL